MTYEEHVATNLLTNGQVIIHNLINNLVDSARLDMLHALNEQPMTPSTIESRGLMVRQITSKRLIHFTERGFIKSTGNQCGYDLPDSPDKELTETRAPTTNELVPLE